MKVSESQFSATFDARSQLLNVRCNDCVAAWTTVVPGAETAEDAIAKAEGHTIHLDEHVRQAPAFHGGAPARAESATVSAAPETVGKKPKRKWWQLAP